MSTIPINLTQSLTELLGEDRIVTDSSITESRSHDYWLLDLQRRLHGQAHEHPAIVVQPQSTSEVQTLVSFARDHSLHIVPFGAGSGVCGSARACSCDIVLDLSKMNRIINLNSDALTVTVQAGMIGSNFEISLNRRGFSMGHFPQSINLSSVGGWVATRASGQYSSKYGSIENMLVSLTVVLADGTVHTSRNVPRSSTGPDLNQLMLGSEGAFGVITEVTYRIHPMAADERGVAFSFSSFHAGLNAIRHIVRQGWKPALLRLYDEDESKRHFGRSYNHRCVLLLLSEGPKALVEAESTACAQLCLDNGGTRLTEDLVSQWKLKRYKVPDVSELAQDKGVVFDTIEVAANWDKIDDLYDAAIAGLHSIPGLLVASAHSSHSYEQGTCLYFSFAAKKPHWLPRVAVGTVTRHRYSGFHAGSDLAVVEALYNQCWSQVMAAVTSNGGTISHHHGIGEVRSQWLEEELGAGLAVLRQIKKALDPSNVFNPHHVFSR